MKASVLRIPTAVAILGLSVSGAWAQVPASEIPTLSTWGLLALGAGLAGLGLRALRRRRSSRSSKE